MIHSRWGSDIKIVARCGQHELPSHLPMSTVCLTLVKVQYEEGDEGYKCAETLKATEGWKEIETAMNAAPELTLTGKELKDALRKAE